MLFLRRYVPTIYRLSVVSVPHIGGYFKAVVGERFHCVIGF